MINTNDNEQIKNYNDKLNILIENILKNGYSENDLKIVITANMFPQDGIVLPAGKESYIFKNPNCSLGIVVRDRIKKVDGIDEYNNEQLATLKKQSEKYMPYSSKYISVVYAAINGLYPDYFATNFIIIDSFKKQIEAKSIYSMEPQEVLFDGKLSLSDEAVFLVNKDNIEKFKKRYPDLNKCNIFEYEGDPKVALDMYLVSVGIVPEKIDIECIKDSKTSDMLLDYISEYAKQVDAKLLRYCETNYYELDQEKTSKLQAIYEKTFFNYLLESIKIPKTHFEDLLTRLCNGDNYDPDKLIILDGIIDSIGADGLIDIVSKFNEKIDNLIKDGKYPINDEILEKGEIELS